MCYYNKEHFAIFMSTNFDIIVEEDEVAEESVLLFKDEVDTNLVPEAEVKSFPELLLITTCIYVNEKEWLVSAISDADTNEPLFLLCLENGQKVYECNLKKKKW